MSTATKVREWQSRVDPLTALVGVIALITYEQHGFDGLLSRDLAIYGYAGQQVADGVPPYLGILNRAGPLAHAIPAIGVVGSRIVGIDELLGIRVLFMVIAVACVCLAYMLGRDVFASRLAGLSSAGALLTFSGFAELASNGPREKTAMVMFLLCALLAVKKQRWFTAGLFLALATLVLQLAFLVGLSAMVVAVIAQPGSERLRALVRIGMGGLTPLSVCLLYFAAVGELKVFIDGFLLINAKYSIANSFIPDLDSNLLSMQRGYGVSLLVIIVGLVALLVLSFTALRQENWRQDPPIVPVAAFGAAGIVAVTWTLRDFDRWPDAFLVLPLAALGIGGLANELIARLPSKVALPLVVTWLVVAVALATSYSITERDHRLTAQRRSVAGVLRQLPPDASILSINASEALVISSKSNPTRHQTFSSGMQRHLDDTWPGGLEGFGEWIGREQPTMITMQGNVRSWMAEMIETDYQRVGRAPGWVWYARRSLGPDVLSDLERAS